MDNRDVIYCIYPPAAEYYSVIENNEVTPFVATWMDLEIITLAKLSQKEKDK